MNKDQTTPEDEMLFKILQEIKRNQNNLDDFKEAIDDFITDKKMIHKNNEKSYCTKSLFSSPTLLITSLTKTKRILNIGILKL
jgi:hypothetical protein